MTLDTRELQAWIQRANDVFNGAQRTQIMTRVGQVIGAAAEEAIPAYPEPSGKPLSVYYDRISTAKHAYKTPDGQLRLPGAAFKSKFKSEAQQGKIFTLIVAGKSPYRRTGTLGKSIASEIADVSPDSVTVDIGTDRKYSPYVIDEEKQSHYHTGTWWTLQGAMRNGTPKITAAAGNAYTAEVDRRLRK